MNEHIVELHMTGYDGFSASQAWARTVSGSLLCDRCHNVYASLKRIDARVERFNRKTDLDLIGNRCGMVNLLSRHFVDVVTLSEIKKTAWVGELLDQDGVPIERYITAISKDNALFKRGSEKSNVELCSECDRMLYWPIDKEYVLREALPKRGLIFSDGNIFCTNDFFNDVILKAKLCRVGHRKIPIVDNPLDGLPVAVDDLRKQLRSKPKRERRRRV